MQNPAANPVDGPIHDEDMDMSGERDSARWKQKYYDSLEQIEKKEKQWQGVENLLRQGIARLTLAARGMNDTLDRDLERLRIAIRGGRDSASLQQLIEVISNNAKRLDQGRARDRSRDTKPSLAGAGDPKAGEVLAQLLDKIALPRRFSSKARSLGKRLEDARSRADLMPLMEELCALLQEALLNMEQRAAPDAPDPPPASDKPDGTGLIKKLFGRGPAAEDGEGASVGAARPVSQPGKVGKAHCEINEVLRRLLARLTLPPRHAPRLALLKECVRPDLAQIEGERVLDDLALLISDALRLDTPPVAPPSTPPFTPQVIEQAPVKPQPALHEMLIRLLELLELPQELDEQADALKDRLEQGVDEEHYAQMLEAMAGLVAEVRARLQREKQEIAEFLKHINGHIREMDQYVQGVSVEQQRCFESGHEFSATVQTQVRGIEQSVQSAVDLEQLKQAVQTSLDVLHSSIAAQRESETQCQATIQRQLHTLTEKLRSVEGEGEQLRNQLQQKHKLALQDSLTGLPNRLAYKERMNHEYVRWKRYASPLTLLVWDVDRFKAINDTYGHKAGDKALKTIAQLLQSRLRKTDFLARYGGEEFVMLMPETSVNDALAAAEKLLVAVANSNFHYREQAVPMSISCGLAEFCAGDTPETAFERADQAMYRAKQAGGNRCQSANAPGIN